MNELDFLVGTNEIKEIKIDKVYSELHIQISFVWEMDFGCFKINQNSFLTVILYDSLFDKLISDLKENKGIVYKYILNHREYTGELLDFRGEKYE